MTTKLARSLGPRQMARALADGAPLNADRFDVTFLEVIDPADPARCDAWNYGNGQELGLFVLVETDHLALHHEPLPDAGHDPARHPRHVWIDNDAHTLTADQAVLVRTAAELNAAIQQTTTDDAEAALQALRGATPESVREATLQLARRMEEDFDRLRRIQGQLREAADDQVVRALEGLGLDPSILTIDPEHLRPILRQAIDQAAERTRGGA